MKVYQIFVDRFSTGSGIKDGSLAIKTSRHRMGGNLKGVEKKLDYVRNLGFDAIWLTPIFSAKDYHGYSTLDFYSIDRHLGSNDDLKRIVAKAHKLGMKIILDFVANHVSSSHKFFLSARNNRNSKYRSWFVFSSGGKYMSFLNVSELPKLNTENEDVINYLTYAAEYWIKNFGIDGYRLDHAIGPSLSLWKVFTRACRKLNSDFVFLPEIWLSGIDPKYIDTLWFIKGNSKAESELMDILLRNRLKGWDEINDTDAEKLAFSVMGKVFDTPIDFIRNLHIRRGELSDSYKYSKKAFEFLDNHDMQRISWIYKNNMKMIDEGIRAISKTENFIIYYGTEVYMTQKRDFSTLKAFSDIECRRFMDWSSAEPRNIERFRKLLSPLP